ncbi:MAG: hypothetical protein ABIQ32_04395 [Sphingomicrobium sp.]
MDLFNLAAAAVGLFFLVRVIGGLRRGRVQVFIKPDPDLMIMRSEQSRSFWVTTAVFATVAAFSFFAAYRWR